jgi:hypothetical protein
MRSRSALAAQPWRQPPRFSRPLLRRLVCVSVEQDSASLQKDAQIVLDLGKDKPRLIASQRGVAVSPYSPGLAPFWRGLRPLRATGLPPSFSASPSVKSSSRTPFRASVNVIRTVAPLPSGISAPDWSETRIVFFAKVVPPAFWGPCDPNAFLGEAINETSHQRRGVRGRSQRTATP